MTIIQILIEFITLLFEVIKILIIPTIMVIYLLKNPKTENLLLKFFKIQIEE